MENSSINSKPGGFIFITLVVVSPLVVSSQFKTEIQFVSDFFKQVLEECLPFLFGHLRDPNHSEVILNILLEISSYEPAALAPFLPMLREIGESFPSLIGQTAKIFGAVGHLDEV